MIRGIYEKHTANMPLDGERQVFSLNAGDQVRGICSRLFYLTLYWSPVQHSKANKSTWEMGGWGGWRHKSWKGINKTFHSHTI